MKGSDMGTLIRYLYAMQNLSEEDVLRCKRFADYALANELPLGILSLELLEFCSNPHSLDPVLPQIKLHNNGFQNINHI